MRKESILFMLLLLASCSVRKDVTGRYSKSAKDFAYEIELYSDSTFLLTRSYFEAHSTYRGKWSYTQKGTIILRSVQDKSLISLISSGYSADSVHKIIIVNGNKIRLDNRVLVRDR